MMNKISLLSSFWLAISLVFLTGCQDRAPTLVPVSGVLKIDDAPAGDISIQFLPDFQSGNEGPTSYGRSAADGSFTLTTADGQPGAVVGIHKVILADELEERVAQGEEPTNPPRLASKYTMTATGLTVTVTEGQQVELNATSE